MGRKNNSLVIRCARFAGNHVHATRGVCLTWLLSRGTAATPGNSPTKLVRALARQHPAAPHRTKSVATPLAETVQNPRRTHPVSITWSARAPSLPDMAARSATRVPLWYTTGMTISTKKLLESIAAWPEEDQE